MRTLTTAGIGVTGLVQALFMSGAEEIISAVSTSWTSQPLEKQSHNKFYLLQNIL